MDVERTRAHAMPNCFIVAFAESVGPNTTDVSLPISWAFGYPGVKRPTMSIRSYFTVKQRDLPELETVVSPVQATDKSQELECDDTSNTCIILQI